jgi:hypothetical protein
MVNENTFPAPGEHVLIPWGLEEVLGEVIEVYSTGLGDKAVVRVLGTSDPEATVTVPADSLTPATGRTRGMSPRIDDMAFRNEITNALSQAVAEVGLALVNQRMPDRGIDTAIIAGQRLIAVQVKFFETNRVSTDAIAAIAGYATRARPVIVIANAGLSAGANERLEHINHRRQVVWFIRWTGQADYVQLVEAIKQARQRLSQL